MSRIEHVPGLVFSDPHHRSGIPCVEGTPYSVAEVLSILHGQGLGAAMEKADLSEAEVNRLLWWVRQVVNDSGAPEPPRVAGRRHRHLLRLSEIWTAMQQQPTSSPVYKMALAIRDETPGLAKALDQTKHL